jgi:hypothetical protein
MGGAKSMALMQCQEDENAGQELGQAGQGL